MLLLFSLINKVISQVLEKRQAIRKFEVDLLCLKFYGLTQVMHRYSYEDPPCSITLTSPLPLLFKGGRRKPGVWLPVSGCAVEFFNLDTA